MNFINTTPTQEPRLVLFPLTDQHLDNDDRDFLNTSQRNEKSNRCLKIPFVDSFSSSNSSSEDSQETQEYLAEAQEHSKTTIELRQRLEAFQQNNRKRAMRLKRKEELRQRLLCSSLDTKQEAQQNDELPYPLRETSLQSEAQAALSHQSCTSFSHCNKEEWYRRPIDEDTSMLGNSTKVDHVMHTVHFMKA